ncbi:uncharacterized protein LOC133791599 [Humulus lupulus]|uniref:uncharacterized protein LOC133791599 n=1 Tax=Humulus lupulus TaxID=3486 RepID=UPI002B403BBA|nr:uncharacterized protein LOC133791599 [Humulus lupulus]
MDKNVFIELWTCIKQKEYIKDTREIKVEEAVAIFLIIFGQNVGMRLIVDRFQHSLETIDRHFHLTLKAICKLGQDIIRPTQSSLHSHIVNSSKYYPWFQGTANDSRVFINAIKKPKYKFPLPKEGEYYVLDSGFPCTKGFLPPYRGEIYHLQEYNSGHNRPRGMKELFNYRHSSLRNAIEQCFGFDNMFREWEEKKLEGEDNIEEANTSVSRCEVNLSDESAIAMARCRDRIAQAMWTAYNNRD